MSEQDSTGRLGGVGAGEGGGGGATGGVPGNAAGGSSKIRAFKQALEGGMREERWQRDVNKTGTGATHVKAFNCKLASESVEYMAQQINEWLEAHPDYEVKFVNTAVGEWTGKIKEPHLVALVWV